MRSGYAARRRTSSTSLLVTFVIGIGVGFSLGYAVFAALQWDFSGKAAPAQVSLAPQETAPPPPPPPPVETPPEPVEAGPEQHLFIAVAGTMLDESAQAILMAHTPGGVVLRRENLVEETQARALIKTIRQTALSGKRRAAPIIMWAWEPADENAFPDAALAAAIQASVDAQDPNAAQAAGRTFAERLRAMGVDAVLGPSLDVYAEAGAESGRTFGDSPALVTKLGIAFADGLLEGGVTPVFRHYPGLGSAKAVNGQLTIEKTEVRALAELMFPFAEAAAHKAPAVFVGHIATPALDRDHPARPASLSPVLVQRVLRGQWAYEGVVLADDLSALAAEPDRPLGTLILESIVAGCDAVLTGVLSLEQMAALRQTIDAAVSEGELLSPERLAVSRARLDLWAARITAMRPESAAPPAPQEIAPPLVESATAPATPQAEAPVPAPEDTPKPELAPKPEPEPEPISEAVHTPESETAPAPAPPAQETPAAPSPSAATPSSEPPPGTRAVRHTIGRGETLNSIARQYNVRVEGLRQWNALRNDTIQYGRRLTVYVPDPNAEETAPPAPETPPAEETAPALLEIPPVSAPQPDDAGDPDIVEDEAPAAAPAQADDFTYHIVDRGDTLKRIAAKYHTTEAKIIELNKIENPNILRMGLRLKVPKPR